MLAFFLILVLRRRRSLFMIIHQQLASFSPSSRQRKADIQGRMKLQSLHISLPIPARRLKYDTNPRPFFLRPVQPSSLFPPHGSPFPFMAAARPRTGRGETRDGMCAQTGMFVGSWDRGSLPYPVSVGLCICRGQRNRCVVVQCRRIRLGEGEGRHQFLSTFPCPWHDMQHCGPF